MFLRVVDGANVAFRQRHINIEEYKSAALSIQNH
jgi:hypothetical protein